MATRTQLRLTELNQLRRQFLSHLLAVGHVSEDDLYDDVKQLNATQQILLHAVPTGLLEARVIRAGKLISSCRPSMAGRLVLEWWLVDGSAADMWLRHNPDRAESAAHQLAR